MVSFGSNRQIVAVAVEAYGLGLVQVLHVLHPVRRLAVPRDGDEPVDGMPQAGHEPRLPHGIEVGQQRVPRETTTASATATCWC